MANYRSLHVRIWSDPVIEELPALARYVFIYLITCPTRNEAALYNITLKRIANDTGLTMKQIVTAMGGLTESGRVMYDSGTSTVWVVNAVKHQGLNDNCIKSILTDLDKCSSDTLARSFADYYNDFKGLQTHPERFPMGSKGLDNPPIGLGIGTGLGTGTGKDKIEDKEVFGEFQNVFLTQIEYGKLIEKLGTSDRAKAAIEILSGYKKSKGKKYASDYATFGTWVIGELEKRENGHGTYQQGSSRGTRPSPSAADIQLTYEKTVRRIASRNTPDSGKAGT